MAWLAVTLVMAGVFLTYWELPMWTGIVAAIATNVSYWNWWGFPTVYTVSYMFIQLVGFFLVGVVAAIMFRRITA